ncbi:MAG: carboxypeptidase regulatory-like domain-containing protein [Planctomycetota bacterium]
MLRAWVSIGILAGMIGCGGADASKALPKTVPATGVVTLDGNPLSNATLTFIPVGATQGIECFGATGEKGEFKMKQLRGQDGAPPGEYKVVISRYVKSDGKPIVLGGDQLPANVGASESLPARYSAPQASKLSAVVPPTGGEFKFDLKSR